MMLSMFITKRYSNNGVDEDHLILRTWQKINQYKSKKMQTSLMLKCRDKLDEPSTPKDPEWIVQEAK